MADTLTKTERSKRMRLVRHKDTRPELAVRRLIHAMGYRYRLHSKILPGHPDIVFGPRKKVIFVHGCFWHRHPGCANCRLPKSKLDFWAPKLEGNRVRDLRNFATLVEIGWRYLVIWECEVADRAGLSARIRSFLEEHL